MRLIALAISCLLSSSLPLRADDAATFNAMLELAKKGDAEAEYHVGMMLNNGIGTPQDPEQALAWFRKSAAANNPLGAYKLGCYMAGQFPGVVQTDIDEALKYKLIAAEAGYSIAQHDVAAIYAKLGNLDEALRWLKLAADQGFDPSLFGLSSFYYLGKGTPKDDGLSLAYMMIALAHSQRDVNPDIEARINQLVENLDESEIAEAKRMASEWQPKPTALTIEAGQGLAAAEEHLRQSQN